MGLFKSPSSTKAIPIDEVNLSGSPDSSIVRMSGRQRCPSCEMQTFFGWSIRSSCSPNFGVRAFTLFANTVNSKKRFLFSVNSSFRPRLYRLLRLASGCSLPCPYSYVSSNGVCSGSISSCSRHKTGFPSLSVLIIGSPISGINSGSSPKLS